MDELIHNVGMKWLVRKGELHGFSVKEFAKNEFCNMLALSVFIL